jgi:hypothetical protein
MSNELPSWLDDQTPSTNEPQGTHSPRGIAPTTYPATRTDLTLLELQFENFFEHALDRLALGHDLVDIADDDPRGISPTQFMRWIKKDKVRKARYYEAQEDAAEFLLPEALRAARGTDSINDSNRDKLHADTCLKVAAMWSPKRFGKESGVVMPMGGGGITINLGTVESPYKKVEILEDVTVLETK